MINSANEWMMVSLNRGRLTYFCRWLVYRHASLFKQYELFLSLCVICMEICNFISFENITIFKKNSRKIAETSLPKIHMFNVVIEI